MIILNKTPQLYTPANNTAVRSRRLLTAGETRQLNCIGETRGDVNYDFFNTTTPNTPANNEANKMPYLAWSTISG